VNCRTDFLTPVWHDPEPIEAGWGARSSGEGGLSVITLFAEHQRFRGFAATTIVRRTLTLQQFERVVGIGGLADASRDEIEGFLAGKRSARTRHAYRSDLRAFYSWAFRRGLIVEDPTDAIESIKVPKGLPRPIQPPPMAALTIGRLRTRRMAALALLAGLRCCEIASLLAEDVWLDSVTPKLLVRGKGGKARHVDIHPLLVELLDGLPGSGPVFPGPTGAPMRAQSVSETLARHLRRAGIRATPHQLRHTFGTEFARACGGDMVKTAAAMGHESMNTTLNYVRLASGDGQRIVRRMFSLGDGDAA
jgi:integrase/recombinase XerD